MATGREDAPAGAHRAGVQASRLSSYLGFLEGETVPGGGVGGSVIRFRSPFSLISVMVRETGRERVPKPDGSPPGSRLRVAGVSGT